LSKKLQYWRVSVNKMIGKQRLGGIRNG